MDKQSLINMLSIGENCEIELKESKKNLPKSIWSTYSAFANSHGGIIILGIKEVKDKFIIDGVENPTNILKDFWNTINNKNKININVLENEDVKILKIESKDIIVITVPNLNRTLKPIYLNKNPMTGTYKRNYEGDYLCTEREVKTLITESSINTKDTLIVENMDMRNINMETLESYRNRFRVHKGKNHEWNNLNDLDFLKMIGAIDRNTEKLTVAGLLVFGNEEDIVKVTTNYFLDYRETLEPEITELFNPDRTILRLEMKKKKNVIENVVESVIENVTEDFNKQQKSILDIILKEPKATQKQIAEQIGITSRQVARILKQLKERKVIERIGSDRSGYWKIIIND